MYLKSRIVRKAVLLCAIALVLLIGLAVQAQNSVSASQPKPAISILDSTKEQDGLLGSVRRVKVESAKIESKDGNQIEGPLQLLELTTYSLKGNRVENISYPSPDPQVGKEEYKYDGKGNIIEMTLRNDDGSIISREAYNYIFDNFGNWTKMTTSLVVFEDGRLKREPVEVTYRTLTYYFDDSIARITDTSGSRLMPNAPVPSSIPPNTVNDVRVELKRSAGRKPLSPSLDSAADPPELLTKPLEIKKTSLIVTSGNSEPPSASFSPAPQGAIAYSVTPANEAETTSKPEVGRSIEEKREQLSEPMAATTSASNQPTARLVTVLKPTSTATSQKTAFDYFQSGRSHFDAGEMKAAVDDYLKSVNLEPKSADVYLNLANAYLKLDKDKEALNAFKQSVKLNADNAEAQYGFGLASFRINRFRDAVDGFKKAVKLDPQMAKAHYGLGLAYQELGEHAFLLDEYRILEKLDKTLAKRLAQSLPQVEFACRQLCH